MIGNYLLLTFRNLGRHKLFTTVNIVSLAVGMAVALLILNYVVFEKSYDSMHPAKERVYRVESQFYEGVTLATVSGRILITLRANPIRSLKTE